MGETSLSTRSTKDLGFVGFAESELVSNFSLVKAGHFFKKSVKGGSDGSVTLSCYQYQLQFLNALSRKVAL